MNRVVSASVTILFLLSASSVTGLIQVAKATSAPIYIRADGSIDPPTTPISTFDNITYTFTGNIVNGSIVVQKDNIVLDGAGFTIHGDGANGIDLSNRSNVKIENTNVENCNFGIYLENSSNNIISWNNATDNTIGVGLDSSSSNNVLSGNNVTANNNGGIELDSSSDNTLSGNNVANNGARGILLYSSSDNTLSGNVMVGNDHNFGVYGTVFGTFGVYGTVLSDFLQSVDTSNLVDGKPVYYFVNQSNIMVNPDAYPEVGYLGFVNCVNVTVQGMNLTNNRQGILLAYTNDSEITGNTVTNNVWGIDLESSSNNTLSGNNVTSTSEFGIWLASSSDNFVFHNSFVNNTYPVFTEGLANIWDNGSTGNYWSDYLAKYPNATERGGSGIWNTPYVIDTNNIDHYPLMAQYNTIPEFPSFLILPLIMITALLAVTIYKKSVKTSKLN